MSNPTAEEMATADSLDKIVRKRLNLRPQAEIACPFAQSDDSPCIVRDGAMCLINGPDRIMCVGCEETLATVLAKAKGVNDIGYPGDEIALLSFGVMIRERLTAVHLVAAVFSWHPMTHDQRRDLVAFVMAGNFDPFTAVVEADRWLKEQGQ